MTIGEIIRDYRQKQQISQRRFAIRCGLSNAYISMLERDKQDETGGFLPTIPTLKNIASAMDMSLDTLFRMLDPELLVRIEVDNTIANPETVPASLGHISLEEEVLLNAYRLKPDVIKDAVWRLLDIPRPKE